MKTHDFDPISFIAGLVVTVIGLVFLLPGDTGDLISAISQVGSWAWPAILIGLGVAVIAPSIWQRKSDQEADAVEDAGSRQSL